MKRAVLGLLALAAVVVVALSISGSLGLEGPARLLVVAGAAIVLVASLDEFFSDSKVAATTTQAPATSQAEGVTLDAASPLLIPVGPETVIDLRDDNLVDELIATGKLSNSREPITDDEVPAIMMAALADQLSLRAA